jgi:hypothetical protein
VRGRLGALGRKVTLVGATLASGPTSDEPNVLAGDVARYQELLTPLLPAEGRFGIVYAWPLLGARATEPNGSAGPELLQYLYSM